MPAQRILKDVSKFRNVDELQTAVFNDVNTSKTILGYRRVLKSGDMIFDNAVLQYKDGDEESAYIFYMRAIDLYQKAKKCRDYNEKTEGKYWASMCGNKIKEAVIKCEELLNSLTRRYSILKDLNEAQLKENAELNELQTEQKKFGRTDENGEKILKNDTDLNSVSSPSSSSSNGTNSTVEEQKKIITCEKLYQILSGNIDEDILILDIRPDVEYSASKINHSSCINIPPDLFIDGATANNIESRIRPADRINFRKRHHIDYVILIDWQATVSDIEENRTNLRLLYDSLYQYDNTRLKRPPVVLEGGYQSFIYSYPTLTTNGTFRRGDPISKENKSSSDSYLSGGLYSYPDLDELMRGLKINKTQPIPPPIVYETPSIHPSSSSLIESKQHPTIPDRKLKPFASSPDVEFNQAVSISKQIDNTKRMEDIREKLLEASKIGVDDGENVQFDQKTILNVDAETLQDVQDEMVKVELNEKIHDTDVVMKEQKEKMDDIKRHLDELRAKKPNVQIEKKTVDNVDKRINDDLLRELNSLRNDFENVKKQRDEATNELKKRDELTKLRKLKKKVDNRKNREVLNDENVSNLKINESSNLVVDMNDENSEYNRKSPSPPIVPKLIGGAKTVPDRLPQGIPELPSRALKPLIQNYSEPNFRQEIERTYRQESEYFTKSLEAIRGLPGAVQSGLTGLRNLGSTCYMNSTVQCLSHTKVLRDYFLSEAYIRDINYTNYLGSKGEVARNFAVVMASLWSGKFRYVVPREFKETIGNVAEQFRGYDQQDAQEFAIFLLDGLHEDLNRVKIREKLGEQENTNVHLGVAAQRAWQNYLKVNNSIIVDHFQGQFLSVITCTVCRTESNVFDGLMYLSVPLPSEKQLYKCSLDDCLKTFLEPERMCDDAKWFCPRCKCKREAYKKFVIWKLPKILVIHLKRFTKRGKWHQKLETFVDFPVSTHLDMNPYVVGEQPPGPYKLYAVVNHFGTMDGGHYTSHCKMNNNWYRYDDCDVAECSQGAVKSDAAYLLFFTL